MRLDYFLADHLNSGLLEYRLCPVTLTPKGSRLVNASTKPFGLMSAKMSLSPTLIVSRQISRDEAPPPSVVLGKRLVVA